MRRITFLIISFMLAAPVGAYAQQEATARAPDGVRNRALFAGVGLGRGTLRALNGAGRASIPAGISSVHAGWIVRPRLALGVRILNEVEAFTFKYRDRDHDQTTHSGFIKYWPLHSERLWVRADVGWTRYEQPCDLGPCGIAHGVSVMGMAGIELLHRRYVSLDVAGYVGAVPAFWPDEDHRPARELPDFTLSGGVLLSTTLYIPL